MPDGWRWARQGISSRRCPVSALDCPPGSAGAIVAGWTRSGVGEGRHANHLEGCCTMPRQARQGYAWAGSRSRSVPPAQHWVGALRPVRTGGGANCPRHAPCRHVANVGWWCGCGSGPGDWPDCKTARARCRVRRLPPDLHPDEIYVSLAMRPWLRGWLGEHTQRETSCLLVAPVCATILRLADMRGADGI